MKICPRRVLHFWQTCGILLLNWPDRWPNVLYNRIASILFLTAGAAFAAVAQQVIWRRSGGPTYTSSTPLVGAGWKSDLRALTR